MKPLFAVLVLLLGGCAHQPTGLHVTGITESRQAVTSAQESGTAALRDVSRISALARRIQAKESVEAQWSDYQLRKKHTKP